MKNEKIIANEGEVMTAEKTQAAIVNDINTAEEYIAEVSNDETGDID